jgi:hypothetical protein
MLETLKHLEDIAIDRELFGRENLSKSESSTIPISHYKLKQVKLICGFERGIHPVASYLPGLRVFESTDHVETILSLDDLTRFSTGLRRLFLKFDRNILNKNEGISVGLSRDDNADALSRSARALTRKRSRSFADAAAVNRSSNSAPSRVFAKKVVAHDVPDLTLHSTSSEIAFRLQRLAYLTHVSLTGATDMIVSSLPTFRYLCKVRLCGCDVTSHILAETMSICESIREVALERCRGFDSLESLTCSKLVYLAISSCPDLNSKLVIDGSSLPALEILSISNQPKLGAITVSNLIELRWMTLRQCNAFSLRISHVPNLLDLALESVTVLQMRIEAANLMRLFLDCARTFVSEEVNPDNIDVTVHINAPELRRMSWQADDNSVEEALAVFAKCPKLEKLDLPSVSAEDVEPMKDEFHKACPALKSVDCADADVQLTVTVADLVSLK